MRNTALTPSMESALRLMANGWTIRVWFDGRPNGYTLQKTERRKGRKPRLVSKPITHSTYLGMMRRKLVTTEKIHYAADGFPTGARYRATQRALYAD